MILTDQKIAVTMSMMQAANMTRGIEEIGVPVDPLNPVKGLRWKKSYDLTESDFDAIETYFLNKQS